MSLKGLLESMPPTSDEVIAGAVTGNLCRCGAWHDFVRDGRMATDRFADGTPNGMPAGHQSPAGRHPPYGCRQDEATSGQSGRRDASRPWGE